MDNEHKDTFIKPMARIVVTHSDKILLVKRAENQTRPGEWEVPGGAVDPGESYEEGALRELQEETGIDDIAELIFDHSAWYEFDGNERIAVFFVAETQRTSVQLSEEHIEFRWVDKNTIYNVNLDNFYKPFLEKFFETAVNKVDSPNNVDENTTNYLDVFTDGGSRGNPGPSATGYVVLNSEGQIIKEGGDYLGITTNNQAEYQAVRTALEACLDLGVSSLRLYIDSMLVVNQMNGEWEIKNRDLWPIHQNIKDLVAKYKSVTFTHIVREKNKLADAKVNEVLDKRAE